MKLHIEEKIVSKEEINLLVEGFLTELLSDFDIIDELSTYIPNFDPHRNYNSYIREPIVDEIKSDIFNMIKELCDEIYDMPKVRNVKPKKSPDMGLSNYIEIKFYKPVEAPAEWRQRYKDLYYMNIKISDHFTFPQPSVTHRIDLLHKSFDDVRQSILEDVYNQLDLIEQAEQELS